MAITTIDPKIFADIQKSLTAVAQSAAGIKARQDAPLIQAGIKTTPVPEAFAKFYPGMYETALAEQLKVEPTAEAEPKRPEAKPFDYEAYGVGGDIYKELEAAYTKRGAAEKAELDFAEQAELTSQTLANRQVMGTVRNQLAKMGILDTSTAAMQYIADQERKGEEILTNIREKYRIQRMNVDAKTKAAMLEDVEKRRKAAFERWKFDVEQMGERYKTEADLFKARQTNLTALLRAQIDKQYQDRKLEIDMALANNTITAGEHKRRMDELDYGIELAKLEIERYKAAEQKRSDVDKREIRAEEYDQAKMEAGQVFAEDIRKRTQEAEINNTPYDGKIDPKLYAEMRGRVPAIFRDDFDDSFKDQLSVESKRKFGIPLTRDEMKKERTLQDSIQQYKDAGYSREEYEMIWKAKNKVDKIPSPVAKILDDVFGRKKFLGIF